MKILYHHRVASRDGQFVHIDELTRALKRQGHEIIMVAPNNVGDEKFGADGGIVKKLKQYVPKTLYEIMEFVYAFHAYRKLVRAIRREQPDVIYERYNLFMPAGIWAKKRFQIPLLLEVNAPLFDERNRYDGIALKWLAQWSERYTWRNADHVLPVTRVLAQRIMQEGVPEARVTVIPNGIDPGKFENQVSGDEAKRKLGLEGKLVLGFAGFMREWHGLEKVLDLLVDQADRYLLLVGDGPARDGILRRAKELGVAGQVQITGVVGRSQIAGYISAFDVALQPDVVDYASPLKLFEYIALGRAIVAPDKPNIREILTDRKNAMLFKPNDAKSFKKAIETICADASLRKRLMRNAENTISEQRLTWDNNAEIVTKLSCSIG